MKTKGPLTTEPLTLSLTMGLPRKARLLAAAKDVSLSKLVSELLEEVIKRELPGLLAELSAETEQS
jgi:hypothetical protein